jgi:hypothetical protein
MGPASQDVTGADAADEPAEWCNQREKAGACTVHQTRRLGGWGSESLSSVCTREPAWALRDAHAAYEHASMQHHAAVNFSGCCCDSARGRLAARSCAQEHSAEMQHAPADANKGAAAVVTCNCSRL